MSPRSKSPARSRSTIPLAVAAAGALLAAGLPLGGSSAAASGGQHVGSGSMQATITRDGYGVPTITSTTMNGMWFGSGYAQAEDRMAQLELVRADVEGDLSSLAGSSELSQDESVRNFFYTPAELTTQFDSLPASTRSALKAFADGINAYEDLAYSSPGNEYRLVPYEFHLLGSVLGLKGPYRPSPWEPEDTVAVGDFLAREFGGGGGAELSNLSYLRYLRAYFTRRHDPHAVADALAVFNDTRWLNDPTAPTTVPSDTALSASEQKAASAELQPDDAATLASVAALTSVSQRDLRAAAAALHSDRQLILRTGVTFKVPSHGGSNVIVVAPRLSADHHALLWGAPQEGFGTPSVDGEEYLHGPGYDAGGMDITGEPYILIGRNKELGWSTTSEELVDQRVYSERVDMSATPPTYYYDHKWVPLTVVHEEIPVAGAKPVSYTVYRTADGPIFYTDARHHVAFAMRFASWGRETGSLEGFSQLGGDTTVTAFGHSMSLVTTLHNFMVASNKGDIAYYGDGLVPIEPPASKVDPRLPALGDGTEQWLGYVPWSQMPRSVNPAQGFLDNWNTKPSASQYYQQNSGDEYWGTIYRSALITTMLRGHHEITDAYLEDIEHSIGQIDNDDNTRPAAPYFIPYLEKAYHALVAAKNPLVAPATHPDLATAMADLASWNDTSTYGNVAMSIFMNTLEALERNVCEGGVNPHEQYVGTVDMDLSSLGYGTFGGLGGNCTYDFLYHVLDHTAGLVPCDHLCYQGNYFAGRENEILVESVNDAIAILSGTTTQLGQDVPGFGTTDVAKWGYRPALDTNWSSLDPAAVGYTVHCGVSASQNRSTFMMALDVGPSSITGVDVLPPGQSGFLGEDGVPSPHLCDQVHLFDTFHYKAMPPS